MFDLSIAKSGVGLSKRFAIRFSFVAARVYCVEAAYSSTTSESGRQLQSAVAATAGYVHWSSKSIICTLDAIHAGRYCTLIRSRSTERRVRAITAERVQELLFGRFEDIGDGTECDLARRRALKL